MVASDVVSYQRLGVDRYFRHPPATSARPLARNADEHLEERGLLPRLEAVERLRVLADHLMRVQEDLVARRMPRDEHFVAQAAHVHDDVIGAARDPRAANRRDHATRSPENTCQWRCCVS